MDAIELLRWQCRRTYEWLELTVSDVTPEQARWRPPGMANSIAANYAHAVIWADVDIMRHFHSRDPLLAVWGAKLGVMEDAAQPGSLIPDEWGAEFDWTVLREYGRAVRDSVERLVDELNPAELERRFQMQPVRLGMWTGLDVYDLHVNHHIRLHGGEIACLKGLQGARGYLGGADG